MFLVLTCYSFRFIPDTNIIMGPRLGTDTRMALDSLYCSDTYVLPDSCKYYAVLARYRLICWFDPPEDYPLRSRLSVSFQFPPFWQKYGRENFVTFCAMTFMANRDDVTPVAKAPLQPGDDMIDGQTPWGELISAIGARRLKCFDDVQPL